ncbi:hypothetical protein E4U17_004738 [Claviceps sp. LM77 group G4]|nr:hypothetical protein E4U17_004738 [Claviceps sp. LM77 group G4]KAG6076632.1 hypothetical protein E4U16_002659 [Claviceps sp. LM84 group G4]
MRSSQSSKEWEGRKLYVRLAGKAVTLEKVITIRASQLLSQSDATSSRSSGPSFYTQGSSFRSRTSTAAGTIQRAFQLSLFLGMLSRFSRLFELSFEEMEKRYRANGDNISMLPVFVWKSSIFGDT